ADGAIIVNDQKLEPVTVLSGRMEYPADAKADIAAVRPQAVFADALALAKEAGTAKAVNLVLLGWLSKQLDFAEELWLDAIAACVKPKFIEINKKAFALGRAL
ncbi:MAG: 2-oxoacid:acceptor oxidoreductase family protein, partial [Firmicutes bacterium]|nr:2-oxoacid:acceptor oxidoreductase family protein [Bacillota bacterium]